MKKFNQHDPKYFKHASIQSNVKVEAPTRRLNLERARAETHVCRAPSRIRNIPPGVSELQHSRCKIYPKHPARPRHKNPARNLNSSRGTNKATSTRKKPCGDQHYSWRPRWRCPRKRCTFTWREPLQSASTRNCQRTL